MKRPMTAIGLASVMLASCTTAISAPSETVAETETASEPVAVEEVERPALEVIATGADIAGSNGIHFGPDGLLYITSVIGSDLTVIDPETGDVKKHFTAADGVIGPDDVAFASDGSYYWTSILTGEVAGFNTDGEKVIAAQLAPGSNPITFSPDDRLFVSQCFLGTNLYELDRFGLEEPRLIADDLGPGCGLNGMDWGPDDRLYGPRWFIGEVVSYDVDSGERRVEATGFTTPAAIKFDSEGVLHVLDTGTGELIRVEGETQKTIATLTPGLDNFAFDANDTPFVSSFTDGFIKRVNEDGSLTEIKPGGMAHPGGIVVIDDTVWVADIHAIRGFDRKTGQSTSTQRNIVGVGALGGSINASVDGENLILTSWFDGDARVWDPVAQQRVAHYPNLAGPVAAIRYAGGLAVSEHLKNGVFLHGGESPIPLATGLPAPTGLVAVGDALYVGDWELGQILLIAQNGEALDEPEIIIGDLEAPEGFLILDDGIVVVEAAAARVTFIDTEGNRRTLAEIPGGSPGAPGLPPSQLFTGIAMDKDGNLLITGETERVLYRLKAPW